MSAFDRGRLGVWHTALFSFTPYDTNASAGLHKLGITDCFFDCDERNPNTQQLMLTKDVMTKTAAAGFHGQISVDGTHSIDGFAIANKGISAIARLGHQGVIQFNIESGDDSTLGPTCVALYDAFRAVKPTFIFGINVAPRKIPFVKDVLAKGRNDPYFHFRSQLALGNMEGEADPMEEILSVVDAAFPLSRFSFTYPAKNQWGRLGIPNVMKGIYDRVILKGDIFNSNLLRELGLV